MVAFRKRAARIIFALFLGMSVSYPISAWATVAANTRIISITTVEYDDGYATRTVQASISVTVNLVACPPILSAPSDQRSDYEGPGSLHTYSYVLTACGNGPDTYDLNSTVIVETNNDGDATSVVSVATVDLGASVLIGGSDSSMFVVPSDGVADGEVNGIGVGDEVFVAGETRTVGAVSDPETGTATIAVTIALPRAPATGELLVEIARITLEVGSGTVAVAGSDIVVEAGVDATNSADTSSDEVISTFGTGDGRLTKYVRNVSTTSANNSGGGARSFSIDGATSDFFRNGVAGGTGDVLEYVLLVENTGTGAMTGGRIVDSLPTPATQFVFDAYGNGRDIAYVAPSGISNFYTALGDQDPATLVGDTLSVNVGEQAGAGPNSGGLIPPDGEATVTFRVRLQ